MDASTLTEIEGRFDELPLDGQLQLIECLVHRLRSRVSTDQIAWEEDLAAMAADPEIQSELRKVAAEFRLAEGDGLEKP